MGRVISFVFFIVFATLLVSITGSNMQSVELSFFPLPFSINAPLSILLWCAMAVSFLAGCLLLWVTTAGGRVRAYRANRKLQKLETDMNTLKQMTLQGQPVQFYSNSTALTPPHLQKKSAFLSPKDLPAL